VSVYFRINLHALSVMGLTVKPLPMLVL